MANIYTHTKHFCTYRKTFSWVFIEEHSNSENRLYSQVQEIGTPANKTIVSQFTHYPASIQCVSVMQEKKNTQDQPKSQKCGTCPTRPNPWVRYFFYLASASQLFSQNTMYKLRPCNKPSQLKHNAPDICFSYIWEPTSAVEASLLKGNHSF